MRLHVSCNDMLGSCMNSNISFCIKTNFMLRVVTLNSFDLIALSYCCSERFSEEGK